MPVTPVPPSGTDHALYRIGDDLVARGLTNTELAEQLFISPKTADHHVSAVLARLGLATRRDVIRRAAELGLE